ncbi:MAG: conjugal transfer protein TraH [Syntrophales bacterium]
MKSRKHRLIILVLIIVLASVLPVAIYAGWVDDWIDQRQSTAPGYEKGRDRGYITAGGFSARWQNQSDYLTTIERPRLKGGCGGIDIFLGGLSFLNFDYLVTKLQRIMQVAPAFAFDIALKALWPEGSETLKSLEGMVNALNSLQLDECQAGKALVAYAATPLLTNEKLKKDLGDAQNEFLTKSGIKDLYAASSGLISASGGKPSSDATPAKMTEGCPDALKDVFRPGSMMTNLSNKMGISSVAFINMLAGKYGDALISEADGSLVIGRMRPCPENNTMSMEDFLKGNVYVRPVGGTAEEKCVKQPDEKANLVKYVNDRLTRVVKSMKDRTLLSDEDAAFMASLPIEVHPIIKVAVLTGQESTLLSSLSDLMAKALAIRMIADMDSMARNYVEAAEKTISNTSRGVKEGAGPHQCQAVIFSDAQDFISDLKKKLDESSKNLWPMYTASIHELLQHYNFAGKIQEFQKMAEQDLSRRFNPGLAIVVATQS